MKKTIVLAVVGLLFLATDAFAQFPPVLKVRGFETYMDLFRGSRTQPENPREMGIDIKYGSAIDDEDWYRFSALSNDLEDIDTGLEALLALHYSVGITAIRPVEADRIMGTPKQADLKLGKEVFQDLQVLRFLADTAAVSRYEGMLKFITNSKNVTHAEIEAYYRQNIGKFVSDIVDEQVIDLNKSVSANVLTEIKRVITEFMLATNRNTYNSLLQAYRRYAGDGALVLSHTIMEINRDIYSALVNGRVLGQ